MLTIHCIRHLVGSKIYKIHENGDLVGVSRPWKMVGIVHKEDKNINRMIPLELITKDWLDINDVKNYRVVDQYHGVYRICGEDISSITV